MKKESKINFILAGTLVAALSGFAAVEVSTSNGLDPLQKIKQSFVTLFVSGQNESGNASGSVRLNPVSAGTDLRVLNERPLALVTRLIPSLLVRNIERDLAAEKGSELFSGDTLRTDENGYALVVFMDRSTAKVRPQSQMIVRGEIDRQQNSSSIINLTNGELFLEVDKRPNNEIDVATSTSVASVKGTKFGARFDGYFWVEEGTVEVRVIETGETVTLTAGMFAQVNEDGTEVETGSLSDGDLNRLASDYKILDNELTEKRLILRFRDANGQIQEEEVIYYEQNE